MSFYHVGMVSITVQLDDDVMQKLQARAVEEGTTVSEIIAQLVSAQDDDGIELSAEQEQAIVDADAEVERGEWVSAEDAIAQLRAHSR